MTTLSREELQKECKSQDESLATKQEAERVKLREQGRGERLKYIKHPDSFTPLEIARHSHQWATRMYAFELQSDEQRTKLHDYYAELLAEAKS